jgi:hypothetical protein
MTRGGVRSQDHLRPRGRVQFLEDLELQLGVFCGGFDDEIRLGGCVVGGDETDLAGIFLLLFRDRSLFQKLGGRFGDRRFRFFEGRRHHIHAGDLIA